ncbi:MAG: FeoA family protein [Thiotrichales bacterium]
MKFEHTVCSADLDMEACRPLSRAAVGDTVCFCAMNAGRRAQERLLSMGLPLGSNIKVLGNRAGAVVIAKDSNRLAIGPGMAEKMLVKVKR